MKNRSTKSEGGPTQDAAKSGEEESMQRGRLVHAGAVSDMGWGTILLDRQADMGQAPSGVLAESYEGRTIYTMSAGSVMGRHWLWRMANERRILNEEEVGTLKLGDEERALDLLQALGKVGRLNILRDIAKERGVTLRVSGGSRIKFIHTGAIDAETIDLNEKTGVLKIGLRRAGTGDPMRSVSSEKARKEGEGDHTAVPITPREPALQGSWGSSRMIDPGEVLRDSTGMLITQEEAEEEREIAASGWSLTPITPLVAAGRGPTKPSVRPGEGHGRGKLKTDMPMKGLKGPSLFRDSPSVKEMSARCAAWKGGTYPPPGVNENFEGIRSRLVIKDSKIAGRGTFVGNGKILKHEALGFYEGILTKPEGAYTMTYSKGQTPSMSMRIQR